MTLPSSASCPGWPIARKERPKHRIGAGNGSRYIRGEYITYSWSGSPCRKGFWSFLH